MENKVKRLNHVSGERGGLPPPKDHSLIVPGPPSPGLFRALGSLGQSEGPGRALRAGPLAWGPGVPSAAPSSGPLSA